MQKVKLTRIGLGLSAIGSCAIWLWPETPASLQPELMLAFLVAVSIWIGFEWFSLDSTIVASSHNRSIANKIFALANSEQIKFLTEHDFGGSWPESALKNVFSLQGLLQEPNFEFSDPIMVRHTKLLKGSIDDFLNFLSYNNVELPSGHDWYSALPDLERGTDQWSEESRQRVDKLNLLASACSEKLRTLYKYCRDQGVIEHGA